jgi:hypothetical protein
VSEKNPILILPDGSLMGLGGKLLFFSVQRFRREIVEGDHCFVCGAKPTEKPINDEHVIPDWVLRECNISGLTHEMWAREKASMLNRKESQVCQKNDAITRLSLNAKP